MTIIDAPRRPTTGVYPTPVRSDDDRFVGLAAEVGAVAAEHATDHDRDASFVSEAYAAMRATGYLRLAVPADLGGLGASMRQVCYAQAELARHDGATALATAMHQYNVLAQVFRRARGAADAEITLRRVADDNMVIATSGGSDWLWPMTVAVQEGDDLVVTGRKAFCSQSPEAAVVTTSAVLGEPGDGAEVLHFALPLAAEGVRLEETWDTLGMRGTASHDLVLERVRVPASKVVGRRQWGEFGAPLMIAAVHFAPVVAATYFGIAAAARDLAVSDVQGRRGTPLARQIQVQRQVGLIDATLRTGWWGLLGALDEVGHGDAADAVALTTVMTAKRQVVTGAISAVEWAMDVVGGRSYFRRSPLERMHRDVRAAGFHPLTPEATLAYAGKVALGDPGVTE
jgi:alkylation response protein AidB-like acyl-CoA dehydrogenase